MDDSVTLKKAQEEIERLGLPIPERPEGGAEKLEWPENVADLTPDQLAEHMTWWSGWGGYARYHYARAETNHAAYSKELKIETQIRVHKSEGDYKNVTELKAAVAQMPDIQRIEAKVLEAEAVRKMVRALLEGYVEKKETVSREITRRGEDFQDDQRKFRA